MMGDTSPIRQSRFAGIFIGIVNAAPVVIFSVAQRPGVVLHRSTPAVVALYDEACEPVDARVWAAFCDKTPD